VTRRRVIASPTAALLALLCAFLAASPASDAAEPRRARRPARAAKLAPRPAPAVEQPAYGSRGIEEEHVHLRRGDTFAGILATRGVDGAEAHRWARAAADVYDLRRIRPRQGLTLRFDRATRTLEGLRYEIDDRALLVVRRTGDGIHAERASLPYFTEVKGAAGRIDEGLDADAARAGVPSSVVSELAEVFGWEVDVDADLRPGDTFRVLYENIWLTGESRPETGKVLAAQIRTRGHAYTAVYFEDADGRGGYYRPDGEPVSRELLRYPVEFTEITSQFSLSRRHPILRRTRPHRGVDFAAPVGTPVRAVASGTVEQAGWEGGLGRCIRLAHANGLESTYGHLSRLAGGVTPGGTVERGQVIGYVGATGLATGPHLHFSLDRDGEYVDPLAVTAGVEPPLAPDVRPAFDRVQRRVTGELAALPAGSGPLTVSLSAAGGTGRE
jgi:murein DD-endopeptidase MepM/ murein hydrolase activator NlpD